MDYSVQRETIGTEYNEPIEALTVKITFVNPMGAAQFAEILDKPRKEGELPFYMISREVARRISVVWKEEI